jgi:hypothetical protein
VTRLLIKGTNRSVPKNVTNLYAFWRAQPYCFLSSISETYVQSGVGVVLKDIFLTPEADEWPREKEAAVAVSPEFIRIG